MLHIAILIAFGAFMVWMLQSGLYEMKGLVVTLLGVSFFFIINPDWLSVNAQAVGIVLYSSIVGRTIALRCADWIFEGCEQYRPYFK